jgi:hypothetical protein
MALNFHREPGGGQLLLAAQASGILNLLLVAPNTLCIIVQHSLLLTSL